ncbi:S-layer homology domain-containing protein [Saccharibacillus sp. CPCC 101409]|uniref:S-layer homology domain-containing protein n=1 Tax=Saccharibacillus sp. CPCC 101409 TaxID=3058041 RepID=UPI002673F39F|nr:S-layer homology domain-containing protein [Saccharibacillus sp. CPCC 101409]MDO3410615.1 S-layer homology domain-containing protein [Saccharibacillus sp. CPCC 101409]
MKKTIKACAALVMAGSFAFAASASAFSDIKDTSDAKIAASLQEQGIMKGVGSDRFAPALDLTNAQAVQLIVSAFGIQSDGGAAFKPGASFNEKAWYASAYKAASQNGIQTVTTKDSVSAKITREAFASLLLEGVNTTGDYATTKMYLVFKDEKDFTSKHVGAVQTLGNMKIISADADGNFRPQDPITRMEAAQMVYNAIEFIDRVNNQPSEGTEGPEVSVTTATESDGRVKATLTVSLPNPGYGLKISDVKYEGDKATVVYTITQPDPGMMYPQVITEATASTYLNKAYAEVTAEQAGGSTATDAKLLK